MILALLLLAAPPAPAAPKKPVTDTYFSTTVKDDYRWLEDSKAEEVQKWSEAQNAHARGVLDALPGRELLEKRLTQLVGYESPTRYPVMLKGGKLFAVKVQPPKPHPVLVVLDAINPEVKERVVFDPAVYDSTGATAMDFFVPSLDGKKVVISLSKNGSESGDGHLFDVDTGKETTAELIKSVNGGTAGGGIAWTKDGFFYTRYPREGERPAEDLAFFQQIYFHALGTDPSKDTYALGKELEKISESFLSSSDDGEHVADLVEKGDGGEFELYLKTAKGWVKVAGYDDKVVAYSWGKDALYLRSKKDAPKGKVVRLPYDKPELASAKVVVAEGAPLENLVATATRIYTVEQKGGPTVVHAWGLDGKDLGVLPTAEGTAAQKLVRLDGDDLLITVTGWVLPPQVFRYTAKDGVLAPTALKREVPIDLSGYEVVRDECTSKDGTKVPLDIVRRKGLKLDGNQAAWLTGYGGFDISLVPHYEQALPVWLEQGGVFAVAHIRGGAELGEAWHQDGMKTKKQNVFDDFIGCAQRLVQLKYTSNKKLIIEGGSNGGLLMGAVMTQQPKLFKAVVAEVGYFDMLRYETAPNGVFNASEYGSVKNEEEYKALAAYSPLQHVKPGQYPSVLLMTGANDPRVEPFHSRKFTAALQASGTRQPVLLRTSGSTGHGFGTPLKEMIAQLADKYAFAFHELGMKVVEPKAAVVPSK
ncbi:MAG: prolyl oligopeptidase family serine peptidase [Myxococcaceae bacterium]